MLNYRNILYESLRFSPWVVVSNVLNDFDCYIMYIINMYAYLFNYAVLLHYKGYIIIKLIYLLKHLKDDRS